MSPVSKSETGFAITGRRDNMALRDPIAVYNAANNVEAEFLRNLLVENGIEAFVTEDVSYVGTWWFGPLPEIYKPQVWIEKTDAERAAPILKDYDRRQAQRQDDASDDSWDDELIEVACEACGKSSLYPPSRRGRIEQCSHCGAYVDVGAEDWETEAEGDDTESQ
jgi:Putative prokaryotic signal transducing protein